MRILRILAISIITLLSINNTALVLSDAANLSGVTLTFKDYSWSTNQVAYGEALSIAFEDSTLFSAVSKGIYNSSFGADYNPHGWYSYRIVVKQQEQDYYNVYTPGVFNFQETSEEKSYFPILGDSINKVTRDKEFANEQEKGLSTSKTRLFPKVISLGTSSDQVQSNSGIIDVISVGTAKEQSLVNKNGHVYNFIFEPEKNHLLAQIPYVSETKSFGIDKANTAIHTFTLPANERFEVTNDSMKQIDDNDASITFAASSNTADTATKIVVGDFLRGADKDLVKVTAISSPKITADGNIDVRDEISSFSLIE